MVRMKPPAGAHHVRVDGCKPDKDGCIEVPNSEVKAFERKGWRVLETPKPKRRKAKTETPKNQEEQAE